MLDRKNFLSVIKEERANPTENCQTLHLVYADWLEEQGDADRAEFIRIQVELEMSDIGNHKITKLRKRERELLSGKNIIKWLGDDGIPEELWGSFDEEQNQYRGISGFECGFPILRYPLPDDFNILEFDSDTHIPADAPQRKYYGMRGYMKEYIISASVEGEVIIPPGLDTDVGAEGNLAITSIKANDHKGNISILSAAFLKNIEVVNHREGEVWACNCHTLAEISATNNFQDTITVICCKNIHTLQLGDATIDLTQPKSAREHILKLIKQGKMPRLENLFINDSIRIDLETIQENRSIEKI